MALDQGHCRQFSEAHASRIAVSTIDYYVLISEGDSSAVLLEVAQASLAAFRRLGRFPLRRLLFRSPPFLHCDGQRLSSGFRKTAFLDRHRSLDGSCLGCRHHWGGSRSSSFRRLNRRPTLLCPGDYRAPACRTHLPFRRCARNDRLRRLRVLFDRRQYRLSAGTRLFRCGPWTLKSFNCSG